MSENQPKNRSGGLSTWLILILLGNIIFLLSQATTVINSLFPALGLFLFFFYGFFAGSPLWSIPLFVTYSVVSMCSVIVLFTWRKRGFYAICLATVAAFLTSIVGGILTFNVLVNCASTLILGILLRAEWNKFQ